MVGRKKKKEKSNRQASSLSTVEMLMCGQMKTPLDGPWAFLRPQDKWTAVLHNVESESE